MKTIGSRILAVIIGGLFIYAGGLKALDPARFATDIFHYRLLPWSVSALVALYLPWLEMIAGVALMTRRASLGALGILSALMLVFVFATLSAKFRGIDIACGCFGSLDKSTDLGPILLRDAAILAGLGWLFRVQRIQ